MSRTRQQLFRQKAGLAGIALAFGLVAFGCGKPQENILGVAPAVAATVTAHDLAKSPPAAKVILHGEMIEKCPVAGCWFVLRDKTGTVRVDTKAAGFVVSDVPLHMTLTVGGTVVPGAQPGLAATGVRYGG